MPLTNPEFPRFDEDYSTMFGGTTLPLTGDGFLNKKALRGPQLQVFPLARVERHRKDAAQVVDDWKASGRQWIAIRTIEPSIHVDVVAEIFGAVKALGGHTFINTNGYWTPELVEVFGPLVDAVDVGFKGSANERFYRKVVGVSCIEPIFETIAALVERGVYVLVSDIPLYHDDFESDFTNLCRFIADTIPESDAPRLKLYPWAGNTPSVAFGDFQPGIPDPEGFNGFNRGALLGEAAKIALGFMDRVWVAMRALDSGPSWEESSLFRSITDAGLTNVRQGEAVLVHRNDTDLGVVVALNHASSGQTL